MLVADDQEIVRTGLRDDPRRPARHRGRRRGRRRARGGRAGAASCAPTCACSTSGCPGWTASRPPALLAGPDVADPLAVVVITTFDLDEYVYGALRAGARGFLLKDAGPELLAQAVHAAADGDALIAPERHRAAARGVRRRRADAAAGPAVDPLTEREEQVLVAVARGLTNAEIADELHISLSTVKTHLASLMAKLGARNRVEIAMWAYETGRID